MADIPKFFRYYDDIVPFDLCRSIIAAFEEDKAAQMKGMRVNWTRW